MKRCFVAFLCTLGLLLAMASCHKNVAAETEPIVFDSISIDSVCPLFRNYEKPSCHISIRLMKPAAGTPSALAKSLEKTLSKLPCDGNLVSESGTTLEEMVRTYVHQYILQYLLDGKEAIDSYDGDVEAASTWMEYEENVEGKVFYNADGFISYQFTTYSYSSGAHGNTSVQNCVFDCSACRPLSLSDIFPAESLPHLAELIQHRLMEIYGCSSLDELSANYGFLEASEIKPTEKFLIDAEGMDWTFDPFELAPFSLGQIDVKLPWYLVKPLMLAQSPLVEIAEKYGI